MPIEVVDWYTREDIQANPDKIYVFGDNDTRKGNGGQAKACRGEPNTIGIRTKKYPGYGHDYMYYTDEEYANNICKVSEDFIEVTMALAEGKTVVFPKDGFGTGLAELSTRAPRTLAYIDGITQTIINIWSPDVH